MTGTRIPEFLHRCSSAGIARSGAHLGRLNRLRAAALGCLRSLSEKRAMGPLWDLWAASVEVASGGAVVDLPAAPLEDLCKKLRKLGFDIPTGRRSLEKGLSECLLPPLAGGPSGSGGGRPSSRYTFHRLVDLVSQPLWKLADVLVQSGQEPSPEWTPQHEKNLRGLSEELEGLIVDPHAVLDMEEWVALLAAGLQECVGAEVPRDFVLGVVSSVVPLTFPATLAVATVLLGSEGIVALLVGRAMARQCRRRTLEKVTDLQAPPASAEELEKEIRRDLVGVLQASWDASRPKLANDLPPDAGESEEPAKKKSRTRENIRGFLRDKTDQVRYALANKQSLQNLPKSLVEAQELLASLGDLRGDASALPAVLASRQTLSWHMLLLDAGLDRHLEEHLYQRRLDGAFGGICLATDESPPSVARFRGLRFQVTCFYIGLISPIEHWGSSVEPPISVMGILGDICHCPGKRGEDVMRVLDKQLGRLGLNRADVVSGTGDGGGENEGTRGIHAAFESASGSYVRRRCLPHVAWRTADAAIGAYGPDAAIYRNLAAYLNDGITWKRLRTLATSPREVGGLALFGESSQA